MNRPKSYNRLFVLHKHNRVIKRGRDGGQVEDGEVGQRRQVKEVVQVCHRYRCGVATMESMKGMLASSRQVQLPTARPPYNSDVEEWIQKKVLRVVYDECVLLVHADVE